MAESATKVDALAASAVRAENAAPTDYSGLRTVLIAGGLIVIALVLWEGLKAFAAANEYALSFGETTIDLTVFNDEQLPHLTDIIAALGKESERQQPPLYQELFRASLVTLSRAVVGFGIGVATGLVLALIFAHSSFLQRGLMPYVVASQTVPIIAIAPIVVVWMGRIGYRDLSIPIISAYLTFFPVTIYTLQGLTSIKPTALELMQTYAANWLEILWKLRVPNALPRFFTALKISATASVVGAIIGELPSGAQDGLGIAILNFSRYYNQSPPRLWATIMVAGITGIAFFTVIALLERVVVRWQVKES
jgi:NitT/TauT family transport system permease protein